MDNFNSKVNLNEKVNGELGRCKFELTHNFDSAHLSDYRLNLFYHAINDFMMG